jgi:hypothetical protein
LAEVQEAKPDGGIRGVEDPALASFRRFAPLVTPGQSHFGIQNSASSVLR